MVLDFKGAEVYILQTVWLERTEHSHTETWPCFLFWAVLRLVLWVREEELSNEFKKWKWDKKKFLLLIETVVLINSLWELVVIQTTFIFAHVLFLLAKLELYNFLYLKYLSAYFVCAPNSCKSLFLLDYIFNRTTELHKWHNVDWVCRVEYWVRVLQMKLIITSVIYFGFFSNI